MTAVPKPLKFLRPHYEELTTLYEEWPAGTDKVFGDFLAKLLAFVLHILGLLSRCSLSPRNDPRR